MSKTTTVNGNYTLDAGHCLFCGRDEFKCSGAAILIHARWTASTVRFCKVFDRLVFADMIINSKKYRVIAVYMPHAGYEQHYFTECFDHLRQAILDGHGAGMRCMVGGDFNIERYRGWRGDRLEELLCEVGLDICNDSSMLPYEDAWTFKSCLSTKRILDYCMVSSGMSVVSSKPINGLHLRSDHRAVQN